MVLVGKHYWDGLVDWIKNTLLESGMINDSDLDLFRVVDTAEDARDKIVEFHSKYNGSNIEGGQSNF